jgi:hypothetical protein
MQKSQKFTIALAALAIVICLCMYLNRKLSGPPAQPTNLTGAATQTTNRPPIHAQRPSVAAVETPEEPRTSGSPRIPREKVEEYLRKHDRNAASLLAAFHALQDTNYLREAATNFPNDPHVQWTILARDAFPEERRKWLDNFKTSCPTNSLANYLSADNYFQNHHADAAMKEMTAAAGKPQLADYSMDAILDEEDLYRSSGSSATEIRTAGLMDMGDDTLHQLAEFKDLARGLQDLQHQYANAGDTASVQALAQMGVNFADRFTTGNSIQFLINKLVSNASEAVVLECLDQNMSYDFLGGETPAQRLADFKQEGASLRSLSKAASSAAANASDDQLNDYWERIKIFGMPAAMQWLVQQVPTTPNTGN